MIPVVLLVVGLGMYVSSNAPAPEIAARLRMLTAIGVSHHILQIQESERWPNYGDALEFVAREVIPRVRQQ